jgi:hypothetical protein
MVLLSSSGDAANLAVPIAGIQVAQRLKRGTVFGVVDGNRRNGDPPDD